MEIKDFTFTNSGITIGYTGGGEPGPTPPGPTPGPNIKDGYYVTTSSVFAIIPKDDIGLDFDMIYSDMSYVYDYLREMPSTSAFIYTPTKIRYSGFNSIPLYFSSYWTFPGSYAAVTTFCYDVEGLENVLSINTYENMYDGRLKHFIQNLSISNQLSYELFDFTNCNDLVLNTAYNFALDFGVYLFIGLLEITGDSEEDIHWREDVPSDYISFMCDTFEISSFDDWYSGVKNTFSSPLFIVSGEYKDMPEVMAEVAEFNLTNVSDCQLIISSQYGWGGYVTPRVLDIHLSQNIRDLRINYSNANNAFNYYQELGKGGLETNMYINYIGNDSFYFSAVTLRDSRFTNNIYVPESMVSGFRIFMSNALSGNCSVFAYDFSNNRVIE